MIPTLTVPASPCSLVTVKPYRVDEPTATGAPTGVTLNAKSAPALEAYNCDLASAPTTMKRPAVATMNCQRGQRDHLHCLVSMVSPLLWMGLDVATNRVWSLRFLALQ